MIVTPQGRLYDGHWNAGSLGDRFVDDLCGALLDGTPSGGNDACGVYLLVRR